MEIKVQKNVNISTFETYEYTFDVDIPEGVDEIEWLDSEGYLDDVDWGDAIFIDNSVTNQDFNIVD